MLPRCLLLSVPWPDINMPKNRSIYCTTTDNTSGTLSNSIFNAEFSVIYARWTLLHFLLHVQAHFSLCSGSLFPLLCFRLGIWWAWSMGCFSACSPFGGSLCSWWSLPLKLFDSHAQFFGSLGRSPVKSEIDEPQFPSEEILACQRDAA